MKWIIPTLALLMVVPAMASNLQPIRNHALASVLGLGVELAQTSPTSGQPHMVRVYAAPDDIGECDGSVESCPDVHLYVSVSDGDLGETPTLFKLPAQKGWAFVRWIPPGNGNRRERMTGLVIRTTLPDSNIDPRARAAWHARYYRILVDTSGGSYVEIPRRQAL